MFERIGDWKKRKYWRKKEEHDKKSSPRQSERRREERHLEGKRVQLLTSLVFISAQIVAFVFVSGLSTMHIGVG